MLSQIAKIASPPHFIALPVPLSSRALFVIVSLGALLVSGCATPAKSSRQAARLPEDTLRRVVVLPIDAEVHELSAGGMRELRDDWTAVVADHVAELAARRGGYASARAWPADQAGSLEAELNDVRAVFRAVSLNQLLHTYVVGLPPVDAVFGPLRYQVGPINRLLEAQDADAALLLFVRDEYATAGRKGLVVLGAVAGIPVRGGIIISSAALVTRDGRVLWMNQHAAQTGDLREREGAEKLVNLLLDGALAVDPQAPALPRL